MYVDANSPSPSGHPTRQQSTKVTASPKKVDYIDPTMFGYYPEMLEDHYLPGELEANVDRFMHPGKYADEEKPKSPSSSSPKSPKAPLRQSTGKSTH